MESSQQNILPSSSDTNSPWTSRTRRIQRFSLNVDVAPVEEESGDELYELLQKTWTIYGVSTLFNFHQDEVHLKQYSKRLREEIAATLTQEDVAYKAKMIVMDHVTARPSPMDPIPIKIEVYRQNCGNENGTEKCIYTGILLSWKTTTGELTTPNSIRLPLLLCRGTQSCMNAIHTLLSHMFDCVIIELTAQEDDLLWLILIILTPNNKEEHSKGEIRMEYRVPGLPDTNAIVVKFQVSDLIKFLRIVMKDQTGTSRDEISFNLEHIKKLRALLYEQTLQTASLQLGLCILCKISLPSFSIKGNKMKIGNMETMNRVLLYLNKKAVGIFHTLTSEV